jgi:phosphatidylinositol kinase/protein kinase (PI-3  family)
MRPQWNDAEMHSVAHEKHVGRRQQQGRVISNLSSRSAVMQKPLSPAAEVSLLLQEAISLDNLSQMYECWSALDQAQWDHHGLF